MELLNQNRIRRSGATLMPLVLARGDAVWELTECKRHLVVATGFFGRFVQKLSEHGFTESQRAAILKQVGVGTSRLYSAKMAFSLSHEGIRVRMEAK